MSSQIERKSSDISTSDITSKISEKMNKMSFSDFKKIKTTTKYKEDPNQKMLATQWMSAGHVQVSETSAPDITDPDDVIVKITNTTICGSDLHLYYNEVPGIQIMKKGDILGHEAVGIITKIGENIKNRKIGERVVISAVISCGQCEFCKKELYSACDCTNPSAQQESIYGYTTAGLFGYSSLTGGYAGLQAEYARVPFGDVNLLHIPDDMDDEVALTLSDIMCTGWHGNELAETGPGKIVVVWGCGPVGLATQQAAISRGCSEVYGIDNHLIRLKMAEKIGSKSINFNEINNIPTYLKKIIPNGPDCVIDCVGFRFPKSMTHWFQRKIKLETDTPEIANECIVSCKKAGNIALIGDYFGKTNGFNIGHFMEKGLTMRGGQLFCQLYWRNLMKMISDGKLSPQILFSHRLPFSQISNAYKLFSEAQDDCIKIILKTIYGEECDNKRSKDRPYGKILQL